MLHRCRFVQGIAQAAEQHLRLMPPLLDAALRYIDAGSAAAGGRRAAGLAAGRGDGIGGSERQCNTANNNQAAVMMAEQVRGAADGVHATALAVVLFLQELRGVSLLLHQVVAY